MKRTFLVFFLLGAVFAPVNPVFAQNDNPTGKTGFFNGNSNTAGSYDPYTANATRTIVDISVPGAVGAYGLQWARTMNTRHMEGPNYDFGGSGSWQHSYNWGIDWTDFVGNGNVRVSGANSPQPTSYIVYYPDGRVVEFTRHPSSPPDPNYRGPSGVTDRFQPVARTGFCYLLLSDGGKIEFYQTAYFDTEFHQWSFDISPTGIIDPYLQRTELTYDYGGLSQVTEPAGRWLRIHYTLVSNIYLISSVEAGHDSTVTQSVSYSYQQFTTGSYSYTTLTGVIYSDGTTAAYTYQAANTYPNTGPPLIQTCDDVRYAGPMKKVAYEFAAQASEQDGGIYGEFGVARKWLYPAPVVVSYWLGGHTESRGDGPQRTFGYGPLPVGSSPYPAPQPYLLSTYTDFKGDRTYLGYDANTYINAVQDAKGNITTFTKTPLMGKVLSVMHPPDATGVASTIQYSYADPDTAFYLQSVTDELGHSIVYQRNSNHRVKEIDYPDAAKETFTFNQFGQVLSHLMTSGGTETFEYDGRGLKQSYRDPYHAFLGDNPTARYQYDTGDRISGVTDSRGVGTSDPNYTTNYEYNQRGQLTKLTHPNDPLTPTVRYTVVTEYNDDSTVRSRTDEAGHATSYAYDDYKRLSSVTAPPAFAGDTIPRTTYFYYDKTAGTGTDYTHSDANVTNVTTPLGNTVKTFYDENFWKRSVTIGTGAEAATTSFTYDVVGNLQTVLDPNGQSTPAYTWYFYDKRNRLTDIDDPTGPQGDRNSLGHTISWTYDQAGNKKTQLRANNQLITYDRYDAMNRLQVQSVQRDTAATDQTVMTYDSAGNLATFTDGRQKQYTYQYDLLNRRITTVYPKDDAGNMTRQEYHYDIANNLATFKDRNGASKTFEYDNRNRETHYYWDTWPPNTSYERWQSYDERSNLLTVRSSLSDPTDTDVMSYDWRNRKTSDTQTNSGRAPRTISYTYDADSNRKTMTYPSGLVLTYAYTSRNRLSTIDGEERRFALYQYDLSGNERKRQLGNGTTTLMTPDVLNRPSVLQHFYGGTQFGRFDYGYDKVGRIAWMKRDGVNYGDKYDYYLDDQLKDAQFDAYSPNDATPYGAQNSTSFAYDANGNRTSQTAQSSPSYTYTVNDLNQYNSVNGALPSYDVAGNLSQYDGWTYGYNRQNLLTVAGRGAAALYFWYDGLNRQILRYENNQWIYSVWDGWNLLEEHDINGNVIHTYVHGAATDEMIARFDSGPTVNRIWYYQDAQGSTTHLADDSGNIIEKYKYDPALSGSPSVFNVSDQQLASSAYGNRFLYTGREYYKEGGLYDMRNRFYHPNLGRFMQSDPLGFGGGDANLFRYCGNDPVNRSDPNGLIWGELFGVAGGIGGFTTGAIGGFTYGVGNQIYSYSAGNGFSLSQVGIDTAIGAGITGFAGLLVGTVLSGDPAAISEAVVVDEVAVAAVGGLLAAAVKNTLNPPSPPQAQPPPPPPATPPSSTPSGPPPVYKDPNGTHYDPNGTALPGGEENSVPPGIGSITPFAFGAPVVTVEGDGDHVFLVLYR